MEVISLVASLVQVIYGVTSLVQYLNELKRGPKDRTALAHEAASLLPLLTELRYSVEETSGDRGPRPPAAVKLAALGGPLDELHDLMTAALQKLRPRSAWRLVDWPLTRAEAERILDHIERVKSSISLYRQEDHFRLSLGISDDIAELKQEARDCRSTQQFLDALNWICSMDFEKKQSYYLSKYAAGTGEWFLTSDTFKTWLDGAPQILWCRGQPGAGKTILTSAIINYLKHYSGPGTTPIYVYCDYKEKSMQTAETLISSLVRQLVTARGKLSNQLLSLKRKHEANGSRPTLEEWGDIMRDEVRDLSRVFLVIDALDECTESDGTRSDVMGTVRALKSSAHVLIMSRLLSMVEAEIGDAILADVQAPKDEVYRYLESRITTERRLLGLLRNDPVLKDMVLRTITENTQGMFLLAQLQMDSVAMKSNRREIRKALGSLPLALHDIYKEALQRIWSQGEEDAKLAMKLLTWTVCAKRPLTLLEVQHALSIETGDNDIDEDGITDEEILVSSCAGLVMVEPKSNVVRLVHHTAQEYFEQNSLSLLPGANTTIAKTCINYLSFTVFDQESCSAEQLEQLFQRYPLVPYAFRYWGDHLRQEPTPELESLALKFLRERYKLLLTARITARGERGFIANFTPQPNQDISLHVAAYSGHYILVKSLLAARTYNTNALDLNGDTPSTLAASLGHTEVISELIRHEGTDINARDAQGRTPLIQAAIKGQLAVVYLLLSNGWSVHVNACDDVCGVSALWWAADSGHEDIVRALLHSDAAVDIGIRDCFFGETALERAMSQNHEAVARLLRISAGGVIGSSVEQAGRMETNPNLKEEIEDAPWWHDGSGDSASPGGLHFVALQVRMG